jgi:hypothetical protein
MKNPGQKSGAMRRHTSIILKACAGAVCGAAFSLVATVLPGGSALADEFPPYPERDGAVEICKQAVSDFYNGKPTKAALEMEMNGNDVLAIRNIWLDSKVRDDQFVNLITADYVTRNAKNLKVSVQQKKFPAVPFLGLTFSVNLPENEVGAELECMFRSYGKEWKLKDLKLGRKGTPIFMTYPITPKAEFSGFPYK